MASRKIVVPRDQVTGEFRVAVERIVRECFGASASIEEVIIYAKVEKPRVARLRDSDFHENEVITAPGVRLPSYLPLPTVRTRFSIEDVESRLKRSR